MAPDESWLTMSDKNLVLVIFPFQQLYLPEFDAFGMFRSLKTTILTASSDVNAKLGPGINKIRPDYRMIPLGDLFTYRFGSVMNLDHMIEEHQPFAVVTYEIYSTFSYQVSKLKRRFGFRHVVISYETIPAREALWGYFPPTIIMSGVVKRNADSFVALSNKISEALTLSGVPMTKIRKFYPGVHYIRHNRSALRDNASFVKLLFMGRLRSNKGIETLLRSFKALKSAGFEKLQLIVAGDGPLENMVRESVKHVNGIVFEGFVYGEKKKRLLEEADIFVYPSEDIIYFSKLKRWEEQTAASVREAMASGLPVIVSDSGSLPEIVGRDDMVFKQGDVNQLSSRIAVLYSSPELRNEIADYNLERCRTLFDMNAFAIELEGSITGN